MNVNKFGNVEKPIVQSTPKGDFFLSRQGPDSNFDAKFKKITNLALPTENEDAATLAFVYGAVGFTKNAEGNLSLAGNRIVDLGPPIQNNEAVTLGYLKSELKSEIGLSKDFDGNLSAGDKKIVSLGHPSSETDAVNKRYVDRQIKRESQVLRRVYCFRSNLETRENFKWLAENGQQYYVVSEPCRVTKVIALASRLNNTFQVNLKVGNNSKTIYKTAGQMASVVTYGRSPIELQPGDVISVENSGTIPNGHHSLEVHCDFNR